MNIILTICIIFVAFTGQTVGDSAPTRPSIFQITERDRRLTIYWHEPERWNGEKDSYNITINYLAPTYFIPNGCNRSTLSFLTLTDCNETFYKSDTLDSATEYEVSVSAKSSGGWSKPAILHYITMDGNPEPVEELKCNIVSDGNKRPTFVANWKMPCKAHTKFLNYEIELCQRSDKGSSSSKPCETSDSIWNKATEGEWTTMNVEANKKYEFKIYARNLNYKSAAVTCLVPQAAAGN